MIERYWNQYGLLTAWLAVIAVALFVGMQASRGFSDAREWEDRVEVVAQQLRSTRNDEDSPPRDPAADKPANEAVVRLGQRYLFMPAPPQGFRNVRGVLGDRVLYPGGQSFGLGDNAMGATVVAIGTNWVELEFEGQTITLDIFNGSERGPEQLRLAESDDDEVSPDGDGDAKAGDKSTDSQTPEAPASPDANADTELTPEQIESLLRS